MGQRRFNVSTDNDDAEIDDSIIMDDDGDGNNHQEISFSSSFNTPQWASPAMASSSPTTTTTIPKDGHLCVVCMNNERSCLYVPCNHLAVCAECDADIMAASLPCPMCNTAIDREGSVVGLMVA